MPPGMTQLSVVKRMGLARRTAYKGMRAGRSRLITPYGVTPMSVSKITLLWSESSREEEGQGRSTPRDSDPGCPVNRATGGPFERSTRGRAETLRGRFGNRVPQSRDGLEPAMMLVAEPEVVPKEIRNRWIVR